MCAIVQLYGAAIVLGASAISFVAASAEQSRMRQIIATHDSAFHCDEVTACFLLKQLDRFKRHQIIRTRDRKKLAQAEIMVDVGGQLDPESLKFDHHQHGFHQTIHHYYPRLRTTNPTSPPLLSSAGLVYAAFGKDFITKVLRERPSYNDLSTEDQEFIDSIFDSVYTAFIEEIDAMDNGLEPVSGENVVYNYHVRTGIGHRVSKLNVGSFFSGAVVMRQFEKAMDLVGEELILTIKYCAMQQGRGLKEFIVNRREIDSSGQIVLVDAKRLVRHWKTAFFELESEMGIAGEIKYLVFKEQRSPNWRILSLNINPNSLELRRPLKEEWRSLEDEQLQKVSGVRDAIFVDDQGRTGSAKSLEGIKEMCRKSLEATAPDSS